MDNSLDIKELDLILTFTCFGSERIFDFSLGDFGDFFLDHIGRPKSYYWSLFFQIWCVHLTVL
jgi:hypothetical protein